MKGNNTDKLNGIRCDCVNCRYHSKDDCCHAEQINVGSHDAMRCGETCCETFTPGRE